MSNLPSHGSFEWLELQDLIDRALYEVYADYDMYLSIRSRAVAIVHDGATTELFAARDPVRLQWILEEAVNAIEAAGGLKGYALVYANEKGRELVFLAAINETEKGICTLELKRNTGDELRDLALVTGDANRSFLENLEWGGSRRKVDVEIRDYIRI
jgi:hypothetical protein